MAPEEFYETVHHAAALPPVYRFPETAARALAQHGRYAEWRRRPAAEVTEIARRRRRGGRAARRHGGLAISNPAMRVACSSVRHPGRPLAPGAARRPEVAAAARELGFPWCSRRRRPSSCTRARSGRGAWTSTTTRPPRGGAQGDARGSRPPGGAPISGYLLQEMAPRRPRGDLRRLRDPAFGPLSVRPRRQVRRGAPRRALRRPPARRRRGGADGPRHPRLPASRRRARRAAGRSRGARGRPPAFGAAGGAPPRGSGAGHQSLSRRAGGSGSAGAGREGPSRSEGGRLSRRPRSTSRSSGALRRRWPCSRR